jgi:hypothetical protein
LLDGAQVFRHAQHAHMNIVEVFVTCHRRL